MNEKSDDIPVFLVRECGSTLGRFSFFFNVTWREIICQIGLSSAVKIKATPGS
jgi:hypothetical protein